MGEEIGAGTSAGYLDDNGCKNEEKDIVPTLKQVQESIMSLFKNWTEGPTGRLGQCCVTPDTLCRDFFPADKYMRALKIGLDIDEKFGLQKFCFTWAMSDQDFHIADKNLKEAFYRKYPKEKISEQTLKEFTEMVYDLIRIKNGLPVVIF